MEQKKHILKYYKKKEKISLLVIFSKFLLIKGWRLKSEKVWLCLLKQLKLQGFKTPISVVLKALFLVSPLLGYASKRIGSSVYKIPTPFRIQQSLTLGSFWLLEEAKKEKKTSLGDSLSKQIILVIQRKSSLFQQRQLWHDQIKSLMIYRRYRWF